MSTTNRRKKQSTGDDDRTPLFSTTTTTAAAALEEIGGSPEHGNSNYTTTNVNSSRSSLLSNENVFGGAGDDGNSREGHRVEDNEDGHTSINGVPNRNKTSTSSFSSSKNKTPFFVYYLTALAAIGGFLFGYDTGVVSGAMLLIKDHFDINDVQQEVVVSSAIGGAILGAFSGGKCNDWLGRKRVIIISSVIFMMGAVVMAVAGSWVILVVGRVIVGIGIGLASMTVPMYIAEAAPPNMRGQLVTINNLFITGGQFVASLVDGGFANVPEGWRYMLGLSAVPAVIQFVGFFFLPESPRWLVSKQKDDTAKQVLQRIRGTPNIKEEYDDILESLNEDALAANATLKDLFATSALRRALFVGCGLQALQQLAGINTVMYYSATILRMAGFTNNSQAIWLSAAIAFGNFAFTLVGVHVVERYGRKKLLISSLIGVIASLSLLGLAFHLGKINSQPVTPYNSTAEYGFASSCSTYTTCYDCVADSHCGYCPPASSNASGICYPGNSSHPMLPSFCSDDSWEYSYCILPNWWLALLSLILYIICFAPGMGPMPWTINSEIYPIHVRSLGISASTTVNWVTNLIISMTFLNLTSALTTAGAFWLYTGISVFGLSFIVFCVPETKGRTLEEVEELFSDQFWMRPSSTYSVLHE